MSKPQVAGDVVAGGSGGLVFLDLNGNSALDAGEPRGTYGADGKFVLDAQARTEAELAAALAVAQAGDGSLLKSPAAVLLDAPERITLSPLTSLVAAEVLANALWPAEASANVRESLGLGDSDPLSNYASSGDGVLMAAAHAASARAAQQPMDKPSTRTPQQFVVRLKDSAPDPAEVGSALAQAHGAQLGSTFRYAMRGFAITVPAAQVDAFLLAASANAHVDRLEADAAVTAFQATQSAPPSWGLDRIDQRALPLSRSYTYVATGAGIPVFVVDSGVRATHGELAGRVSQGFDAVRDGQGTNDCNGHGTHVAATIGGKTAGVARLPFIVPVRVLGCGGSGTVSSLLSGLDWIHAHAQAPAVVNISAGSAGSAIVDDAVGRIVGKNIVVVAAAGNAKASACNFSPARAQAAITVGGTDSRDRRTAASNYGTCVDLFAPGSAIVSAGFGSDTAMAEMTGTSMAAAHVAGLASMFLQANPEATPAQAVQALQAAATTGRITNLGAGSIDAFLFTDLSSASLPPSPPISSPMSTPISAPISAPLPPVISTPLGYVGALTAYAAAETRGWKPSVTVAVASTAGSMVAGAEVTGSFTKGGSNLKCVTGTNGTCVILGGKLSTATADTAFSVTNVAKAGLPYDPVRNVIGSVTIARP